MDHNTWRVEIDVADSGDEVTARARLDDGPVTTVGLGSAHHDEAEPDLEPASALAVGRSLADLSRSLRYLSDARTFALIDQA
jgi:hypothetical protein